MTGKETIEGFSIEKRDLTEEEANRDITLERFQEFHIEAGEDFLDYVPCINHLIFSGWLIAKYPAKSKEILVKAQEKYAGMHNLTDLYEDDPDQDKFYTDVAEFLNLTEKAKKRANQVLIQVIEYYKS